MSGCGPYRRLLALSSFYAGFTKLATLAADLAKMMPWTGVCPGLVLATGFHLSRCQFMVLPMDLCLLALAAFVLWGRARALPLGRGRIGLTSAA